MEFLIGLALFAAIGGLIYLASRAEFPRSEKSPPWTPRNEPNTNGAPSIGAIGRINLRSQSVVRLVPSSSALTAKQGAGSEPCPIVKKVGISGGKATAALLTAGISTLATGLSRKEKLTQAHCENCDSTWNF